MTIPYEQTFRNIDKQRPGEVISREGYEYDFCGCGWPNHMLVPRGSPESDNGGFACQLFAMISKYDDDHVEQDLTGTCSNASAYCGIRDRLYPDKRNMGFPFDRVATKNDGELIDFLLPNMNVTDCKIIFNDENMERMSPVNKKDESTDTKNDGNNLE